jgi:hypothetical protein
MAGDASKAATPIADKTTFRFVLMFKSQVFGFSSCPLNRLGGLKAKEAGSLSCAVFSFDGCPVKDHANSHHVT